MTTEELALSIKEGKTEYIQELWERLYRLIYKWALRYCTFSNGDAKYSIDDLIQSAYFALISAVNDYTDTAECKFVTYLFHHCRKEFRAVLGIRTSKKEISTVSLDESLTEEDDFTLSDTISDESAEEAFEEIDDKIYQEYCHERLNCAIDTLPEVQQQVIIMRYYENRTFREISEQLNYSYQCIQTMERTAIRNLRRGRAYTYLQEFDERPKKPKDVHVDMYSGSLSSWRNIGTSSTERAAYELMMLEYID